MPTIKSTMISVDQRASYAIAMQFWINGAIFAAIIPRLPDLRDQFGVDLTQLGIALSVAMIGGMFGSLTVDRACRYLGVKRLMIFSSLLAVLCLSIVALSPTVWVFAILFGLMAWLDVYADVAMNIQGSQLSDRAPKPIINRLHGSWSAGTVFGSLVAAACIYLDISLHMQLSGLAVIFLAMLVYVFLGLNQQLEDVASCSDASRSKISIVIVFGLLGAAAIIPEMISSDWSAFRIHDDLGYGDQVASLGFLVFSVFMMFGRLIGDEIMHRLGYQRTFYWGCSVGILGLCLVALLESLGAVFIGLALGGLGISVLFPVLYDQAVKASNNSAKGLGALTMGSRVGVLGLPALVGYVGTHFGVWMAFLSVGVSAILIVLLLMRWATIGRIF